MDFFGINHPSADIENEDYWSPIVTVEAGTPDTESFRQHAWDKNTLCSYRWI